MQFIKHDLGQRSGGEIVEVTLSNAATVRLMDSSNFHNYRNGRRHRYYGGHVKHSPFRLKIPNSGRWYVAVDLGGYSGRVGSSVRMLPGRLRPVQEMPLSSVPTLVRNKQDDIKDVFISYASEDKDEVVDPLVQALKDVGLSVWYDEFELKIGASLRQSIDKGINASRFGIVVLSKAFFDKNKGWTDYELDGLVTKTVNGEQVLLPIWHNITKDEVISYSASLTDKVARNTISHTVEDIAAEIIDVVMSVPVEA